MSEWIDTLRFDLKEKEDIQLLGAINATYIYKKKESSFHLCIVLKDNSLGVLNVKPNSHSIKNNWDLTKLSSIVVDAKPSQEGEDEKQNDFALQFDNKTHLWEADKHRSKLYFIQCFITNSRAYLSTPVSLMNVSGAEEREQDDVMVVEESSGIRDTYEELTQSEAADIEFIMGANISAIKDIDTYAGHLRSELNTLESANVAILLQSEAASNHLNTLFDDTLNRIDQLDSYIKLFNDQLGGIRGDVQKLAKRDALITVQNRNHHNLQNELSNLLDALDPHGVQTNYVILEKGNSNLDNERDRADCLSTIKKLSGALKLSLQSGLGEMQAVESTIKQLEGKELAFTQRFKDKMREVVDRKSQEGPGYDGRFIIPSHQMVFKSMTPYKALVVSWLKNSHQSSFYWLIQYYQEAMATIYNLEFQRCANEIIEDYQMIDESNKVKVNEFGKVFNNLLLEFEKTISKERKFCEEFFGSEEDENETMANVFELQNLRTMLGQMFRSMWDHINRVLDLANKIDPFLCVQFERYVDNVLSNTQHKKFVFAETLARMRITLKRTFDTLVQQKIDAITTGKKEQKTGKKRDNLFFVTTQFGPFLQQVKAAVEEASRTVSGASFVENKIIVYCQACFSSIDKQSEESKVKEVCLFENYHYVHSTLAALKMSFLDNFRTQAHAKYKSHMQLYIETQLGSPLEKVAKFMTGVQRELESGVLESEVSFQLQYSKQNLKKVVESHPARAVKKQLAIVYQKIERDLSSDSHLLQVVWRNLTDEFTQQYNTYQSIIERCYQGSGIDFDFNIQDLYNMIAEVMGV